MSKDYPSAKARHMAGACSESCFYCTERAWLKPQAYFYPAVIYKLWCSKTPKAERKKGIPHKVETND